ncbi:MAG: hypothetical protein ACOCRZ_07085 [Halothermotrichaceae bacterium]
MLNRTQILERLIRIRKKIYKNELQIESPPSIEDIKLKKEMDNLINEIIGDFLSDKDQDQIDRILLKVICDEIPVNMAMVAIKEIVASYFSSDTADNKNTDNKKAVNFKKGYR